MNIKIVAKKAGVSVATVSRVLNHPDAVTQTTRQHVLSVMESLEYTPNWFARGLKLNRTGVIGLLIPDILDPGYMEIAKGVEDVVRQKKCNMMLCSSEGDRNREKEQVETILARKVDGILLVSSLLKKRDIEQIKGQHIPVVLIGKDQENQGENVVYTDYEAAAAEAARHLIEIGYSRIGIICGTHPQLENEQKLEGIRTALAKESMTIAGKIFYEENSIEGGYLAATKLIEKEPPEAVLITSDTMAIGAMEKIKQTGLKIPQDIAVVGFDNLKISGFVEPKLTTVAKPMYRMGLVATRLLLDLIEDGEAAPETQEIMIQSKLKVRKSCGRHDRLKEIF